MLILLRIQKGVPEFSQLCALSQNATQQPFEINFLKVNNQ